MYSATIDYLGKKFDVDYEITQDHNGDDEFQVESIMLEGTEMMDFLECMYVTYSKLPCDPIAYETAVEAITRMIEEQHYENDDIGN